MRVRSVCIRLGEVLAAEFGDKVKIEYLKDEGKTGNFELSYSRQGNSSTLKRRVEREGQRAIKRSHDMRCNQGYLDST